MPTAGMNRQQRRRLALEAYANEDTIRRVYQGAPGVRESTRLRIAAAAEKLGLPSPPEPTAAPEKFQ